MFFCLLIRYLSTVASNYRTIITSFKASCSLKHFSHVYATTVAVVSVCLTGHFVLCLCDSAAELPTTLGRKAVMLTANVKITTTTQATCQIGNVSTAA